MQLIKIFLYILPSFLITNIFSSSPKKSTVLVCYGKLIPESIKGYNYVILESKNYSIIDIKKVKSQNKKVFAYMSLGEVNVNASHFEKLKDYTIGKNLIWNSFYLDLKSEKTKKVMMSIIDKIFAKGYDGLFLDNIDNFTKHGPQKEQKSEFIALLKMIQEKYPKKEFIQNSGLDIIEKTNKYINIIAIESVASKYSFVKKSYELNDSIEFNNKLTKLKSVNKIYNLPVLIIEYANTNILYQKIINRIKASKFEYFIGNIDLQNYPKFKK